MGMTVLCIWQQGETQFQATIMLEGMGSTHFHSGTLLLTTIPFWTPGREGDSRRVAWSITGSSLSSQSRKFLCPSPYLLRESNLGIKCMDTYKYLMKASCAHAHIQGGEENHPLETQKPMCTDL